LQYNQVRSENVNYSSVALQHSFNKRKGGRGVRERERERKKEKTL
jgi:hypothetical protein